MVVTAGACWALVLCSPLSFCQVCFINLFKVACLAINIACINLNTVVIIPKSQDEV